MYYIVGSWKKYVFVFDSSDNSCEMIDGNILKSSGLSYQLYTDTPVDKTDFRLTYGMSSEYKKSRAAYDYSSKDEFNYEKILAEYTVLLSNGKSCRLRLKLFMTPSVCACSKELEYIKSVQSQCYGYPSDYGMFLGVEPDRNFYGVDKYNAGLEVIIKNYGEIGVPRLMVEFVVKLIKSHNLNVIFSITDGLFWDKLYLFSKQNVYDTTGEVCNIDTRRAPEDIVWGFK